MESSDGRKECGASRELASASRLNISCSFFSSGLVDSDRHGGGYEDKEMTGDK